MIWRTEAAVGRDAEAAPCLTLLAYAALPQPLFPSLFSSRMPAKAWGKAAAGGFREELRTSGASPLNLGLGISGARPNLWKCKEFWGMVWGWTSLALIQIKWKCWETGQSGWRCIAEPRWTALPGRMKVTGWVGALLNSTLMMEAPVASMAQSQGTEPSSWWPHGCRTPFLQNYEATKSYFSAVQTFKCALKACFFQSDFNIFPPCAWFHLVCSYSSGFFVF